MPKCILAFAGHMMDAPYRAIPRFPACAETAVRLKIRRAIQRLSPVAAVSSAACGGDIIFAEEIRWLGIPLYIILPFRNEQDFIQRSVAFAGDDWIERFYRVCREAAAPPHYLRGSGFHSDQDFADNQQAIVDFAEELTTTIKAPTVCLALYDKEQTDGLIGGTWSFLDVAKTRQLPCEMIDMAQIRRFIQPKGHFSNQFPFTTQAMRAIQAHFCPGS